MLVNILVYLLIGSLFTIWQQSEVRFTYGYLEAAVYILLWPVTLILLVREVIKDVYIYITENK